ncbi:hypothetical protein ACTFIZ_007634 [Dictyostelium cf. discoideum]
MASNWKLILWWVEQDITISRHSGLVDGEFNLEDDENFWLIKGYKRPKTFTSSLKTKYGSKDRWVNILDGNEKVLGDTERRETTEEIEENIEQKLTRTDIRNNRYNNLVNIFQDEKTFRVCFRLQEQEKKEIKRLEHQIDKDNIRNQLSTINSRIIKK